MTYHPTPDDFTAWLAAQSPDQLTQLARAEYDRERARQHAAQLRRDKGAFVERVTVLLAAAHKSARDAHGDDTNISSVGKRLGQQLWNELHPPEPDSNPAV